MNIQTVEINKIKPAAYNPRLDLQPGDPDYEKLKKSILEFELVEPLVWNKRTGNLVGGHQRLKILKELGEVYVEVSVLDISLTREKALNLALNQIQGDWDLPKLTDLLQELDTGEFDLDITGFDAVEIEDLMTQFHPDARSKYLLLIYGSEEERDIWLERLGLEKLPSDRHLITLEDIKG